MDEDANRYARELLEAINAAIAESPEVQRCRARARAAGIELQLVLEAKGASATARRDSSMVVSGHRVSPASPKPSTITAADRRFLRSLRISADEPVETKE